MLVSVIVSVLIVQPLKVSENNPGMQILWKKPYKFMRLTILFTVFERVKPTPPTLFYVGGSGKTHECGNAAIE